MSEQLTADVKNLVGEIFQLTGQKVEVDDPIVVAALIHSQLIRRAGQDAMSAIQTAITQAIADLGEAIKSERQATGNISQATTDALSQIVKAAKAASDTELPKMQVQFVSLAQDVLKNVRKEASASAPHGWKVKVGLGVAGLVMLGGLAGGIIGATLFSKNVAPRPSDEEIKQLAAGRDFIQVLPQLDQATRDKVVKAIQKNQAGQ